MNSPKGRLHIPVITILRKELQTMSQAKVKFSQSIKTRIVIMVTSLLILVSLSIGLSSYFVAKKQLESQGKIMLENTVNMIMMLIDAKNEEVKRGSITLDEAQEQVKTYILGKAEESGKEIEVAINKNGDKGMIKEKKRPLNKQINLGEYGYPIVYSLDAFEVAHPSLEGANIWNTQDKSKSNQIYVAREQIRIAQEPNGGFLTYAWTYPGSDKIGDKITYQKLDPNWGWVVIAGTYMSDFNKGADQILTNLALVVGISLIVGVLIALVVINRIIKPILAMIEVANELAAGDFRDKPRRVKNHDEVGLLADALIHLRTNVRDMLAAIEQSSNKLYSASETLTASAEQSAQASNQVAISVSEVAIATDRQLNASQSADQLAQTISQSVHKVKDNTVIVTDNAKNTIKMAHDGAQVIQQVVSQMHTISNKSEETASIMTDLENKSQEIGRIVDVILGISDQTNLLALNAAIEAARAGETGRGFAVVADEVRKLAEQSKESAAQITELIKQVQHIASKAVLISESGRQEAEAGNQIVETAGHSFNEIQTMIENMTAYIENISQQVTQMTGETDQVTVAVNAINQASQKNSEETETISAATEEQSATTEEIAAASESLAAMAEELQAAVKRFTT